MSLELGTALCGRVDNPLTSSESFSVLHNPAAVQLDIGRETRRKQRLEPAIRFTSLLVLGLRRVRVEFAKRVQVWRAVASIAYCPPVPPPSSAPVGHPNLSPLAQWLSTPAGRACIRELRWLLPTVSVVGSRLRREPCGVRVLSSAHLLDIQASGVPLWIDGSPSWGPQVLAWEDARAILHTRCSCPSPFPPPPLGICVRCGCARVAPACPTAEALKCPWCRQRHGSVCRMCHRLVHFRGDCGWNRGAHTVSLVPPKAWLGVSYVSPSCAFSWRLWLEPWGAHSVCSFPS
eukprot:s183_g17.t1